MGDAQVRKSYLAQLEKVLTRVKEHDTRPVSLESAQDYLIRCQEVFEKYEKVQERLIQTCVDDSALDTQVKMGYKVEEAYHDLRSRLRLIIETLKPVVTTPAGTATTAKANIKLPPIELPSFDGTISDWSSFKDLFCAAVANNGQLSGAQKLQYLKAAVKGEAEALIKALSTTDANYVAAWKLLVDRYDNDREIVFALIKKLLFARPVREENATEIQLLIDLFEETTRALGVLKRPVSTWDDILVVLLTTKLDSATRREWAIKLTGKAIPTYSELIAFLSAHVRGLKSAEESGSRGAEKKSQRPVKVYTTAQGPVGCLICKGSHPEFQCQVLKSKSVSERRELAKGANLCFLCLGRHMLRTCRWKGSCRKCGRRHHTLLHMDFEKSVPAAPAAAASTGSTMGSAGERRDEKEAVVASHHTKIDPHEVMMTAIVLMRNRYGELQPYRCLVDAASGPDLITEETVISLGLRRQRNKVLVTGVAECKAGRTRGLIEATVESRYSSDKVTAKFHIMKQVTGYLPGVPVKSEGWTHLDGLELADPNWSVPGKVDLILGIKHFHKILLYERRVEDDDDDAPVGWESIFGWLIAGPCVEREAARALQTYHVDVQVDDAVQSLKKFFELEEIPKEKELSAEEAACEQHFQRTHRRDESGRFHVAVPFNEKKHLLGGTRAAAVQRFYQVERRMKRDSDFRNKYVAFMKEYLELGHMRKVEENEAKEVIGKTAHLPHHGVINNSSTTTKLRVVFDGSATSTTGISLNETMMVGATMQDELYNLLLLFRLHEVVVKADIVKMFRNFDLEEEDADFHRIVWREDPNGVLEDYRLTTVTYGTAYAPFVATRCLHQLALDCAEKYPAASHALINNTYVDDVIPSVKSAEEAINLYNELTTAAATAGLQLRKWMSNDPDVMAAIPENIRESEPLSFDEDNTVKALGVQWHPREDVFKFKGIEFKYENEITKRKLLSDAARVFDPLGLISCFSIRAKMLIQDLWKLEADWDEKVPKHVEEKWSEYKEDVKLLTQLKIDRRIVTTPGKYEIVGYSDSSERALGSVIYIRHYNTDGSITVSFVTSKTRVAPVKLVTLPRLELEAAVMLAKLVKRVISCLKLDGKVILLTDSTITLKWIQGPPHRWKTYIGNRVAKIQRLTSVDSWKHVPGTDNPADLASRGVTARELLDSTFWWKGPKWLSEPTLPTFKMNEEVSGDLEERPVVLKVYNVVCAVDIMERFSSLRRLKRVTARILRYVRRKVWEIRSRKGSPAHEWVGRKGEGPLTASELEYSLHLWVCKVQRQHYEEEIHALERGKPIKHNSKLSGSAPFLDNVGVLRVGGRLTKSELPNKGKHPIILPAHSHLTYLVILEAHQNKALHGDFLPTWASICSEFWIVRGRDKVRHIIRKCVTCRRYRASAETQMMGNLPTPRVTQSRPFQHTGVDYAGPFTLKNPIGRAPKTYKGYLCLFVCLATKALHLEAVSSLSTEGFLEAFRRFVSRRGLCAHMYSDCGTNFVGADKELRKLMKNDGVEGAVATELGGRGIEWHFNPPAAPHKGGLWEAGVKSAKFHLRRVVGNAMLTYEQFCTILCQIEAVLNSRPLYALSPNPTDYDVLTPGHFLIGEPLIAVPTGNLEDIPKNRLTQFQLQQQRVQHFWKRWSAEYLNTLQQRTKWRWESENVAVGDLVLIIEESSPGNWKMGRVSQVHPGDDGLVRSVMVRTVNGESKRPVTKLVPLLNVDSD